MKKIIIFGWSSYIGLEFINHILKYQKDKIKVYIFFRGKQNLYLLKDNLKDIEVVTEENLSKLPQLDAVINFAYIGNLPYVDTMVNTRKFFNFLVNFANFNIPNLFIHTSTLAVFGYRLEKNIIPNRVHYRFNDGYCDGKILAENILIDKLSPKIPLAIVRLGNVMGKTAPNWTWKIINIASNLQPFTINNRWGYSNVTYIDNIISYYLHLIDTSPSELKKFGYFHHLAEFSNITWDKWIIPIINAVGIDKENLDFFLFNNNYKRGNNFSLKQILIKILKYQLYFRFFNFFHYLSTLNYLDDAILQRLNLNLSSFQTSFRSIDFLLTKERREFIDFINIKKEFQSYLLNTWKIKKNFEQALSDIIAYLKSLYIV